jgi:hypothetical protein
MFLDADERTKNKVKCECFSSRWCFIDNFGYLEVEFGFISIDLIAGTWVSIVVLIEQDCMLSACHL